MQEAVFPRGTATVIGSWPFTDPGKTSKLIMEKLPALPAWPQLPRMGFRENMYVQFSEGMPRVVVDEAAQRISFDTTGDFFPDIQAVYEGFLAERWDTFAISKPYAHGLHDFRDLAGKSGSMKTVKGQLIGPVSFGLTVTDQDKKLILYNEQFADAILKTIVGKTAWQVLYLKAFAEHVVIFIDEPYLVSFGSAYVNLSREQVIAMLGEVVDKIHELGALAGVHCCGGTDWSLLTETGVDIINFDAYSYGESILLYPRQFADFLGRSRNSRLAWGIVPTAADKLAGESEQSLLLRLKDLQARLSALGVDRRLLEERTIITPSCGMGSVTEETAHRVMDLLGRLSPLYAKG
jgi:hypothetical protein